MMQIYTDALKASIIGATQLVLCRSLDMVRISGEKRSELLSLLKEGYKIKAVANNGVLEETFDTEDRESIRHIGEIVDAHWNTTEGQLHITTQEFFSDTHEPEGVYLYLSFFQKPEKAGDRMKPDCMLVTPKDTATAEFEAGQEKAQKVLDYLNLNWHQYSHGEAARIRILEKDLHIHGN